MSNFTNKEKIRIWEKIIDVQKHFNEIKSKNQTLFISIITASLIVAGYLYKIEIADILEKETHPDKIIDTIGTTRLCLDLCCINFELCVKNFTLPLIIAAIFTVAFYILDFGIYHTLLIGSVACGKKFEKKHIKIPLTSTVIEKYSINKNFSSFFIIHGAGKKLQTFYLIIFSCLVFSFAVLNKFYLLIGISIVIFITFLFIIFSKDEQKKIK